MGTNDSTAGGMASGCRRVEAIMGTIFSLDLRDDIAPEAIDPAFAELHAIDARFSTYRADSEVSRLGRGELPSAEISDELREVLELADELRRMSGGAFDVHRHQADGGFDPSGIVKGWAIERAQRLLDRAGARNYTLNGGGDVVARGTADDGLPWRIGIAHPTERDRVAAVLGLTNLAVATSGSYERGDHIRDPRTGRSPDGLWSVSVVGPSILWADAYATTAYVMGLDGLGWVAAHDGYGACGITRAGRLVTTDRFEALRLS